MGNFSATSRKLSIPIVTIIRKINALEKELGVNLFYRTTRKVTLTKDGDRFLERFGSQLEILQHEFIQHKKELGNSHHVVKIATLPELAQVYIYPILPMLLDKHPSIQLEFEFSSELVDVNTENIDFALRAGIPDNIQLRVCKVGTDRLSAYRHAKIDISEALPLATYDKTFIYDERVPHLVVPSMQLLKSLAETLPIEVYLSERWLEIERSENLHVNANLIPYEYDIYLTYGRNSKLSNAARIVLDTLKTYIFDKN
ncbi:HTH-type transcriptional regulator DmlR [Serratia sp. DD3]|nr:HTH-type transcriptional regulator DmlR [Serratia sp. DD3]